MAAQLLAAHRNGQARVVIGRASDYYGPHGTGSTAGETVFGRILAGNKPRWTGRLDQPHTFHYLPDIARGLLVLADRREADGQVWHLPAAGPLTAQQFFDIIATAAAQPVPVHASIASPALLAVAGIFSPLLREMRETTYQFRALRHRRQQIRSRFRPPGTHPAPRRDPADRRLVPVPLTAGHRARHAITVDYAHCGPGPHAPHAHRIRTGSQICTAPLS
jgi:nucleoside-diphosphate-sugar epimerase